MAQTGGTDELRREPVGRTEEESAEPMSTPDEGLRGERERLGRIVREVWIEWAREQADPKPSWLVPWEGLSEPDREVDRRIGERLAAEGRTPDSANDTGAGEREAYEDWCSCATGRPIRCPKHDPATPPADVSAEGVGYTLSEEEREALEACRSGGALDHAFIPDLTLAAVERIVTAACAEAVAAERERIAQAIEAMSDRLGPVARKHGHRAVLDVAARIAREPMAAERAEVASWPDGS